MIACVSFVPIGEGTSLSAYVAQAVRLIRESGLPHEFHSMGTNIQGEFDQVMDLVKRCNEALFAQGAQRVLIRLSIDDRRDQAHDMQAKRKSVESKLAAE